MYASQWFALCVCVCVCVYVLKLYMKVANGLPENSEQCACVCVCVCTVSACRMYACLYWCASICWLDFAMCLVMYVSNHLGLHSSILVSPPITLQIATPLLHTGLLHVELNDTCNQNNPSLINHVISRRAPHLCCNSSVSPCFHILD